MLFFNLSLSSQYEKVFTLAMCNLTGFTQYLYNDRSMQVSRDVFGTRFLFGQSGGGALAKIIKNLKYSVRKIGRSDTRSGACLAQRLGLAEPIAPASWAPCKEMISSVLYFL